jgi:hypothetical protein
MPAFDRPLFWPKACMSSMLNWLPVPRKTQPRCPF